MSTYFYQPKEGHGLPHDPFNAIVAPRPIGWVSKCNEQGQLNLAPYSFFTAFNYTPPLWASQASVQKTAYITRVPQANLSGTWSHLISPAP